MKKPKQANNRYFTKANKAFAAFCQAATFDRDYIKQLQAEAVNDAKYKLLNKIKR